MLQKWSKNLHKNCRNTFWTLTNCPVRFVTLDYSREKGQNFFFTGKIAFFFKTLCFPTTSWCYRSDVITSTVIVRILFGPLQNVPWGLSHSIIREKGPKSFFHCKVCLFFQKFVFNNLLDFLNFDLNTSAVKLNLPRGLLQSVHWDLSFSITRLYEKKKVKIFFSLERLPFFQEFMFPKNLLGVTEVKFWLPR